MSVIGSFGEKGCQSLLSQGVKIAQLRSLINWKKFWLTIWIFFQAGYFNEILKWIFKFVTCLIFHCQKWKNNCKMIKLGIMRIVLGLIMLE